MKFDFKHIIAIKNRLSGKEIMSFIKFMCIPTVIMGIIAFSLVAINYGMLIEHMNSQISSTLTNVSKSTESDIVSYANIASRLSGNGLGKIYTVENFDEQLNSVCGDLYRISELYPWVDSVFAYSRRDKTVVDNGMKYKKEEYFENCYSYENYNAQYWEDFRFYSTESYVILPPTRATASGEERVVIPVVFQNVSLLGNYAYVIANIDLQLLAENSILEYLPESSQIYMHNKYSGDAFEMASKKAADFPTDFLEKLNRSSNSNFKYTLNNEKMFVSLYSPTSSLAGYTYFSAIPTKNIRQKIFPSVMLSLLITVLFFAFSMWLASSNTMRVFSMLRKIHGILSGGNGTFTKNVFDDILRLSQNMRDLNRDFKNVLPCAQEKYLIDLLNANDMLMDSDTKKKISETLKFSHSKFAIVIVQIALSDVLLDIYNSVEYNRIRNGLYSIVREMFSESFSNYVLPMENNILYVILNFETEEEYRQIDDVIFGIYKGLESDSEYANISVGRSGICNSITDLKKAHADALENFTEYKTSNSEIVLDSSRVGEPDFNSTDEKALFYAFSSSNSEEVYEILNEILQRNQNAVPRVQKKLYNYILSIMLKVMRIRKIPYKDGMLEFEIINECMKKPLNEIYDEIMELTKFILKQETRFGSGGTDYDRIIEYVKNNFDFCDMSLDFLAQYFKVNRANLSTALKRKLGVGFHDYLTYLRIDKAQKLLSTTDKNIADIGVECGFLSKQTFYRVFKSTVGMTAGEYRANIKNEKRR